MKKFTILLHTILLLLIGGLNPLQAQNCSLFTGSGGDIFPDKRCAPVGVTLQARFFSPAGPDVLTDIKIRVDWADGSAAETFTPTATLSANGSTWTYEVKNITHVYPEGGDKCNYEVYARPVINGTVCNSYFYKGNVTVWDKDNANGGNIALNPQYYYVCPGEEFSLTFNDVSVWNCTPPLENDNINWPARWTQFVYGTGTTPGPRINGIEVDGSLQGYPYRGNIKAHPDWQLGPDHTSLLVKVPATAAVGEVFEVTLRNWNSCNPYDDPVVAGGPGNTQDGDYAPVTNIAIIKIVDRPEGIITTKNKDNVITDSFCPNERVRFEGLQTKASVSNVQYDWLIYNDATGNELLQEKKNTKNWNRDAGFPTAGQKLIRLRIRNKEASNACWAEIDKIINVYTAPEAEATLNGVADTLQQICWNNAAVPMEFGFKLFSSNDYKYQLSLYKRNSTALAPDSTILGEQLLSGGQSFTAVHNANLLKPGSYKVQINATDRVTGCNTVKESEVIIYGKPKAAFTFPDLCEGLPVSFQDASTLPVSVNGDTLKTWQWDIDYNGSSFNFDYTGKEAFKHTYPAAGTYQVALLLTTSWGCSDTLIQTVEVKPVPKAALSYNYTQPICPGDPILFTNTSVNDLSRFPEGITYTLVVSDNSTSNRYPMPELSSELSFKNPTSSIITYAIWLEAKANNPNNCALVSDTLKVDVKPGALAGFIAPAYDALQPNCAPLDLLLVTNQATRDIVADRYTWTVSSGGTVVQTLVQNRGDAGFDTLRYAALNTTADPLTYTVKLVAEKANQCIQPAEEKYRVNPVPLSDYTVSRVSQSCDETVLEVKVNNTAGIKNYKWTIFPEPDNLSSVVYDDYFQLIYKRPTTTAPSYEVDISLVTENYYECPSLPTAKKEIIYPQELSEVKVVVISANDEGCSPLDVEFENQTIAPAGTQFTVMMRLGSSPEQELIPVSGDVATRFTYSFMQEGNYQVWLKATAPDGCMLFQTVPAQVVVYPASKPYFTVDKTEGCGPLTVSLNKTNITGSKRTWLVTDLSNNQIVYGPAIFDPASTDNFSFITLQNEGAANKQYRILLETESAQGCRADSSLVVTVYPQPKAWFEVKGSTNICEPYTIEVKNNSTNPAGTEYTWEWGDGTTTSSTSTTVTKTYTNNSYTATLNFPVRLITTTPSGCSVDSVVQITVAPMVLADFEADRLSGCAPLQVNFTNRSMGNSGAASGWFIRQPGQSDFEPQGSTLSNFSFANTTNNVLVYDVRYIAANSAGCADTLTRQITVNPAVDMQIGADVVEGCGPLKVTFQNLKVQQGVRYTWQWGDGSADAVTTTAASLSHTFENNSTSMQRTYTVRVLAENIATGCTSSTSQQVTVYPQVLASVTPTVTEGCGPLQLSFQNNSQNADTHFWRVIRKDDGAEVYTTTNRTPDMPLLTNETGNVLVYQVQYRASSAQGCASEQQHEIKVYPGVSAAFSMDVNAATCGPTTVTFTNSNVQQGVRYIWQWGDGYPNDTTTTETQVEHTFTNDRIDRSRFYEVTLSAQNTSWGCSSVSRQTVQVYPSVQVSVSPDKVVLCAPEAVSFANRSQNVSAHEWWYRLKGTTDKLEVFNSVEVQYQFSNNSNAIQNFEVVYVGTSSTGCTDTAVTDITVYPALDPAFTVDNERPSLPNAVVNITNTTPHAEAWTYTWEFGDGTSSTDVHPASKRYEAFGTYTITLTISNGRCTKSYSKEIKVGDTPPLVDFEAVPVAGCAPLPVQFNNTSQYADPNSYYWDFGDGEGFSTAESPSYTYSKPGQYEVTLTARNFTGETRTMTKKMVTVYEVPRADFAVRDAVVYVPGDPVYVANYSTGADSYFWDFGDGTTYTEESPVHNYQQPGIYSITLIATSQWGCSDTLTLNNVVTAEAGGLIKIPNAFTPNPGGPNGGSISEENNDVFFPVLQGGVNKFNMRIYNRWGELLFETKDRNTGWNGYYKGRLCKSDVYAYKIYVEFSDGRTLQQIGDVTLIR